MRNSDMSPWTGLSFAVLLTAAVAPAPAAETAAPPEQSRSAAQFLDSVGMNPSLSGDAERKAAIKRQMLALGIHHVRVGLDSLDIGDLAKSGIRSTVVVGMPYGPNNPANGQPTGPPYNGTLRDVEKIRDRIKRVNAASTGAIDAVETSNEPDIFWNTWYNQTYGGQGYPGGPAHFGRDLYATLKADPATARLTVIGTAIGQTPPPGQNPQGNHGELAASVDWGNAHPYPGKGGTFSFGTPYDAIPADGSGHGGYEWNGSEPTGNMEVVPYFFNTLAAPFAPKPMACTETGYFTGTGGGSVTQTVLAKYVPRLFAEYFRLGVRRTFWYDFVDDGADPANADQNRGLLFHDLTPKPAFVALHSLMALLRDSPRPLKTRKPATLAFSLAVSPVLNYKEPDSGVTSSYDRTKYVHHLLLQKSDGTFCLLLWHEVADSAGVDKDGRPVAGTGREIAPPALPVALTLPRSARRATLYSYNARWQLIPRPLPIGPRHQATLRVPDTVTVVSFTASARETQSRR